MVSKKGLALGKRVYVWLRDVGVGLGRTPGVGVGVSEGVWGCRMSYIEPGLPSGRVTSGGAFFCNKGMHWRGV